MLCLQKWPDYIFHVIMYPLCKDCIHHQWCHCKKTHVDSTQSRRNECLCGEAAAYFSPSFASLAQSKYTTRRRWEEEIRDNPPANRSISHRPR